MNTGSGSVAVVTGAGSGIGRATALRFARSGAEVIVADIDEGRAVETVALIEADGGAAHAYRLDVGDAAAFESFASSVRVDHGVPDVVVNNAGFALGGTFMQQSAADWDSIVGVNLMGVVHGCRLFGGQMVERGEGGHIVNIASCMAYTPSSLVPSYSVTKAAVLMASDCLRIELAEHDIGVTAICPGGIRTNIGRDMVHSGVDPALVDQRRRLAERVWRLTPVGPDKVARAIARSIRRNWAIVPVNPESWVLYGLSRLSPGLMRSLAGAIGNPARVVQLMDELLPRLLNLDRGETATSEASTNGNAKVTV